MPLSSRQAAAPQAGALALLLAVAFVVAAAPAAAHTPGSAPVAKSGTFELGPEGSRDSSGLPSDEFHVYFVEMGFPIGTGDTFEIHWAVNNGSGPEVYFEIHTHENGWTRYYTNTTSSLNLTWVVPPANDTFMIYWVNHWPVSVNVSYTIVDKAPEAGPTPLLLVPVILVGAAFGWFLWVRAVPEQERQGPGGRPVARPSDGEGDRARAVDEGGAVPGDAASPGDAVSPDDGDDEAFQRAVEAQEATKSDPPGGEGG